MLAVSRPGRHARSARLRIQLARPVLLCCAVAVALSGCASFHPHPIDPARTLTAYDARSLADSALRRFVENHLARPITAWPPAAWDLPTLTAVAFYYHPDLDRARARYHAARAAIVTAGGRPHPGASLSPQWTAQSPSGVSPWTLGFSLDVPLETGGKRQHRVEQAERLADAAFFDLAETAWQVRSRVRAAVLEDMAARRAVTLLADEEGADAEIAARLERRLAVGEAARSELHAPRAMLASARSALQAARARAMDARGTLASALGVPLAAVESLAIAWPALDTPLPPDSLPPAGVQRIALLRRDDVHSALARYVATEAALALEVAKQYPDLVLHPGYSWDQGLNKYALGVGFTLPVLARNRGPIAEAEAHREEAAAHFVAVEAVAVNETAAALAAYSATMSAFTEADTALAGARRVEESVARRLRAGAVDRLELARTHVERLTAERARLDALLRVQTSLGRIEDAMQQPLDGGVGLPAHIEDAPRDLSERGGRR